MDLILASTSPHRRALVERLGLPFRCIAPTIDEEAFKREWAEESPRELARRLAEAKALSVASSEPTAVVIGGDQVACFEGSILGKPRTADRAVAQLLAMSGLRHELITAIHVIHDKHHYAATDTTTLHMRCLTHEEVFRYVSRDEPLDCCGSYKVESRGIALFESIESADHSAIVGVPLIALTSILRSIGFEVP